VECNGGLIPLAAPNIARLVATSSITLGRFWPRRTVLNRRLTRCFTRPTPLITTGVTRVRLGTSRLVSGRSLGSTQSWDAPSPPFTTVVEPWRLPAGAAWGVSMSPMPTKQWRARPPQRGRVGKRIVTSGRPAEPALRSATETTVGC